MLGSLKLAVCNQKCLFKKFRFVLPAWHWQLLSALMTMIMMMMMMTITVREHPVTAIENVHLTNTY